MFNELIMNYNEHYNYLMILTMLFEQSTFIIIV